MPGLSTKILGGAEFTCSSCCRLRGKTRGDCGFKRAYAQLLNYLPGALPKCVVQEGPPANSCQFPPSRVSYRRFLIPFVNCSGAR